MNFLLLIEEKQDMVLPVINDTKLDIDYNLVQIGNKSLSDYITEHINMDKFLEVSKTEQLRKDIDEVLQRVKDLEFRYETANAITKFQEGVMWLGMYLKYLGETDNYPEVRNPDNQRIEPISDGLKL